MNSKMKMLAAAGACGLCALVSACSHSNPPPTVPMRAVSHPPSSFYDEYLKLDGIAVLLLAYGQQHNGERPASLGVFCDNENDLLCRFVDPTSGRKYDWLYYPDSPTELLVVSPTTFKAEELIPFKVATGDYRLALKTNLELGLVSERGFQNKSEGSNAFFLKLPRN